MALRPGRHPLVALVASVVRHVQCRALLDKTLFRDCVDTVAAVTERVVEIGYY
jgi:hypothetical protein